MTNELLKINNTTIPKLVSYKISRAKLWKDSDRNMNGDVRATLIGIFPKISIKIGICTENEMALITSLLDQAFFNATYYDPRTKETHTAQYYASDYDVSVINKQKGLYEAFSVNLVPVSKRGY